MRDAWHARPAVKLAAVLVVVSACADARQPADVTLAPALVFARGVLDGVTRVTVTVYESADGLDCDPTTGKLTEDAKPFVTKELASSANGAPCPSGGRFCGDLTIAKSAAERLFQARATSGTSDDVADGCAKATVNEDALPLKIVMVRNVPPAVCGNGTVEATEQCEPPGGTCDAQCHSKEQLLSNGAPPTSTGAPGDKTSPFFLWPAGSGDGGRLIAVFGDRTANGVAGSHEIEMRVMSDAFAPIASSPSATFLPDDPVAFPSEPQPKTRELPVAAIVGSRYFVVFEDDGGTNGTATPDIHLRSMDTSLVAQQAFNDPVGINGPSGAGEQGTQTAPAIAAGPGGALFIAWEDDLAGKIAGRTYANGALGAQVDISSGTGNKRPGVAATANGWTCVWEAAGDVKLRTIDASGAPSGSETLVNESTAGVQDHPVIAAIADGRFAVAWSDHQAASGADIVLQRFGATGAKVAGDQAAPLNTTTAGDQVTPAIAAMNAAGGSFVVVWLDAASRHVRGRLAGGASGFLFNNVDGLSGDFQASVADGRARANPTVAAGGAGPFLAIGWEDQSASAPFGIVGRRFPVPAE